MGKKLDTVNSINNLTDPLLKRTFEASRSPLIVTDNLRLDNPIIYSNQAFLDLCGYDLDEVIGRNCRFLQGDDSDEEAVATLREAVEQGTDARVTLKNYRKDGVPFWNDLIMSPIKDDAGKVTHFVGMQLDITDRMEAQQALVAKTEQLEQSNHELEQFTYATSHDLQEPLRMINSYLQLIRKRYGEEFDEDGNTFLDFASEGADRMQALINDLLTLSRLSDDSRRYKKIAMREVVDRSLNNLKLLVEETGTTLTIGRLPTMCVDPVQITQLFQNLINNAIKYRRAGVKPVVDISARKDGGSYIFTVKDNGIGIEPKHFDRVFTIFQRLHTRSEYPGTGIGLTICAKIIKRHNGSIWVESEPGKGSSFMFSMPVERG